MALRVGNLEGDMDGVRRELDDLKRSVTALQEVAASNTTSITQLIESVKFLYRQKKEISKYTMIIITSVLTVIGSIISALVVIMVTHA